MEHYHEYLVFFNILYDFFGSGNFVNDTGEQKSLDITNLIVRGCCLKNTNYIVGFVAYTGHETKIMMNAFRSKSKMSTMEKSMGKQILIIFLVQVPFIFKFIGFFNFFDFVILDCVMLFLLSCLFLLL